MITNEIGRKETSGRMFSFSRPAVTTVV